jgi:SAM-dependent methyltransferase
MSSASQNPDGRRSREAHPELAAAAEVADPQSAGVRSAGDRTITQYHDWMKTNAASHLLRAARQSGLTEQLRQRQHTLDELCQALSTDRQTTELLLQGLVAIGFVEQYQDDYALARAGHLLCQYDDDLGDARWERLVERMKQPRAAPTDDFEFRSARAATQWVHTSAAMQAAEILDLGGESSPPGPRILDLGCGSAVWSCAMAHRDAEATIVAVDEAAALQSAKSTAESIGLGDRIRTIESDPRHASLGDTRFDLVVIAQQLSVFSDDQAAELVRKATAALHPGGRLALPDFYDGPGRPGLAESVNRLEIHLSTPAGRVRDLRFCQRMLLDAGLEQIQFVYLPASRHGLGMIVATRPTE